MAVAFLREPSMQFCRARAHIHRETARKSHFANRHVALSAFSALLGLGADGVEGARRLSGDGADVGEGHLPLVGVVVPAQPSAGVSEALHLRGLLPGFGFLSELLSGAANETRPTKRKRAARPRRSKGASGEPRKAEPQARFPRPRLADNSTDNSTDI